MKNVFLAIASLLAVGGVIGTIYFYMNYDKALAEKKIFTQQNAQLQSSLDAIGPMSEVLTVRSNLLNGTVIREEDLVVQMIPQSSVSDSYIKEKSAIVGLYWKVDVTPGTSITKDLILTEPITEVMYERDISFAYLPLGLRVGDYVDIRVTLPYGEEYMVMSHKRVQQLVQETNTIKVLMNEEQISLWTSALKDLALYKQRGLQVYITKYIEPGLSPEVVVAYPVRKEMEEVVLSNPNIKDTSTCVNPELRDIIEEKLAKVTDEDASSLFSGSSDEASKIVQATTEYKETQPTGGNQSSTLKDQYLDAYDYLTTVNPEKEIIGSESSITSSQIEGASGQNPYQDTEKDLE